MKEILSDPSLQREHCLFLNNQNPGLGKAASISGFQSAVLFPKFPLEVQDLVWQQSLRGPEVQFKERTEKCGWGTVSHSQQLLHIQLPQKSASVLGQLR
jgi:hypothetical protein